MLGINNQYQFQAHRKELQAHLIVLGEQIRTANTKEQHESICSAIKGITAELRGDLAMAVFLYSQCAHPFAVKFLQKFYQTVNQATQPVHQTFIQQQNIAHIGNVQVTQQPPAAAIAKMPAPVLKSHKVEFDAKSKAVSLSSEEQNLLLAIYDHSQRENTTALTNYDLEMFFNVSKAAMIEMLTHLTTENLIKKFNVTHSGLSVVNEINKLKETNWQSRPALLPQRALDAQRSKRPAQQDTKFTLQEPPKKIAALLNK